MHTSRHVIPLSNNFTHTMAYRPLASAAPPAVRAPHLTARPQHMVLLGLGAVNESWIEEVHVGRDTTQFVLGAGFRWGQLDPTKSHIAHVLWPERYVLKQEASTATCSYTVEQAPPLAVLVRTWYESSTFNQCAMLCR